MGHLLDKHGYRPGTDKEQEILKFPQPTSKEGLARFIGMVNYFRKFIPHFTAKVWELENEKNAKTKGFNWTEEMQESFEDVKH